MSRRGFTLLETMVVVAIVAIVAAIAVVSFQATRRNTSLDGSVQEITALAQGLKVRAMSEQDDHLLVIVSPPGNDASGCGVLSSGDCLRAFVLRTPDADWKVQDFDPDSPGDHAAYVDVNVLPPGILLDLGATGRAAQTPFDGVTAFAPDVTAACDGGTRTCVAVRFGAEGEVTPEYAAPAASRAGVFVGFTTDQLGQAAAAQRRGLLVSAPGGITRIYPL